VRAAKRFAIATESVPEMNMKHRWMPPHVLVVFEEGTLNAVLLGEG
jgi:hypothetical protein